MASQHIKDLAQRIPLLTVNAGPRDGDKWTQRLKEEYLALIKVCNMNVIHHCREMIDIIYLLFCLKKKPCGFKNRKRGGVLGSH